MKFAIVEGERRAAAPNLKGECPGCGRPTLAKCGEVRIWHWAHKGHTLCDRWWESETEWHRAWKDLFPAAWQEILHPAEDGLVHIADVKTDEGWVLEFQHSYIDPTERRSRDAFYPKLIWVHDGLRRKRDKDNIIRAYNDGMSLTRGSVLRLVFPMDCRVLEEWAGSTALVFFDLGETDTLWWLMTRSTKGATYLQPVSRTHFIEWLRNPTSELGRAFEALGATILSQIFAHESRPSNRPTTITLPRLRRHFRF